MLGAVIGYYRVEEELGRGAFGVTCRGVHQHVPGQQVALKIVHADLMLDPAFRADLERASHALRSLLHPGVASFLTLGTGGALLGVVRELVPGESASALAGRRPLAVPAVVALVEGALAGLAGIHGAGLAHGDFKPTDLFLCPDRTVRVTDPGLGVLARRAIEARVGQCPGDPGYLAPERAATPAGDLYAVGLIAWELLVGRRACPAGDARLALAWHAAHGPMDPQRVRSDCPDWLAEFVLRLGASDPAARPLDARAASALLGALRAGGGAEGLSLPVPPARFAAVGGDPEESTLPHASPAPSRLGEVPTLPQLAAPRPDPAPGVPFGQEASFQGGAAPSAAPARAWDAPLLPVEPGTPTSPARFAASAAEERARRNLGPAPAPVVRGAPADRRREQLKVAAFWSVTLGALFVALVSFGGHRAMEARRLAAARADGPDIDPALLVGDPYGGARDEPDPGGAALGSRVRPRSATAPEAAAVGAVAEGSPPVPAAGSASRGAPAGGARLSLTSNPIGARVWVDNVEVGLTPLDDQDVAPGHHVVRVELEGYHWSSREVTVERGGAFDLGSVPLERVVSDAGPVRLWGAGLDGAACWVDGRHVGSLPIEVVLTPGPHAFFLQPVEGAPVELRLDVAPGREGRPADLRLDPR